MEATYFGLTLSEALGLNIFLFALAFAAVLMYADRNQRINLELPYGSSIPYTLAVVGGGVLYLSSEGPFGLAKAIALGIFLVAIDQQVVPALKQAK